MSSPDARNIRSVPRELDNLSVHTLVPEPHVGIRVTAPSPHAMAAVREEAQFGRGPGPVEAAFTRRKLSFT